MIWLAAAVCVVMGLALLGLRLAAAHRRLDALVAEDRDREGGAS